MRKDLFKTLFSRMLATYLAVTLGLLVLMGLTVTNMFKNHYIQEQEDALRREGMRISSILLEKYLYADKQQAARDEMVTIARRYDALIQVVDSNGGIGWFYDMDQSEARWGALSEAGDRYLNEETGEALRSQPGINIWPSRPTIETREPYREWAEPGRSAELLTEQGTYCWDLFSGVSDFPTLSYVRALISRDAEGTPQRIQGVLLLHFDMSGVNASIHRVFLDVVLTSLLAVLAATIAVYYITTRITKPITDMSATVRRYSKGEFDLRLADEGADEMAQLARSFNLMADEVNDLEQTRRSFVANVSHELRSPLTSMQGFLTAIQDGTIPEEEQGKYLALVIDETRRMTAMVNDLLNLARMESGQEQLTIEPFDLNELILRTLMTFETRINDKGLEVHTDFFAPHCPVEADSGQIAQVLRNLVDNAIKFSPAGGLLSVGVKALDRTAVAISVSDAGAGIPEEDLPHIFERFYKAEKAHTPSRQGGTGLGLAIVKRIIDQHDQDISVESSASGTRFTFTLKRAAELPRPRRTPNPKSGGEKS